MILHLESKLVISHLVYTGTPDIFQVSSWKSVSLFHFSKLNEDEVSDAVLRGSADWIGGFLSTFCSYFLL